MHEQFDTAQNASGRTFYVNIRRSNRNQMVTFVFKFV